MKNVTIQQFMSDLGRDPVLSHNGAALTPYTLIDTMNTDRTQVAKMLERLAASYRVPLSHLQIGDLMRSRLNVQDIYEVFYRETLVKKMRRGNVYGAWIMIGLAALGFYCLFIGQPLVSILAGNTAAAIFAYIRGER